MHANNKDETVLQWLGDAIIIYVIPFSITAYIVVSECWPYNLIKNFFPKNNNRKFDVVSDVIYTGVFLVLAGIFWCIKQFFKSKK